jgi:hypothetical protein
MAELPPDPSRLIPLDQPPDVSRLVPVDQPPDVSRLVPVASMPEPQISEAPVPQSNQAADFLRRIPEGMATGAGQTLQGAARAADLVERNVPERVRQVVDAFPGLAPGLTVARKLFSPEQPGDINTSPGYLMGQQFAEDARQFYGVDRARDEEFVAQLGSALGGIVPTLISGAAGGPIGAALQYGMVAGEQGTQEAIAADSDQRTQDIAFLANAGIGGVSEGVLGVAGRAVRWARQSGIPAKMFGEWAKRNPVIARLLEASVREGSQEGLEQMASNVVASDVAGYDPERPVMQNVGRATTLGMVAGPVVAAPLLAAAKVQQPAARTDSGQSTGNTKQTDPLDQPYQEDYDAAIAEVEKQLAPEMEVDPTYKGTGPFDVRMRERAVIRDRRKDTQLKERLEQLKAGREKAGAMPNEIRRGRVERIVQKMQADNVPADDVELNQAFLWLAMFDHQNATSNEQKYQALLRERNRRVIRDGDTRDPVVGMIDNDLRDMAATVTLRVDANGNFVNTPPVKVQQLKGGDTREESMQDVRQTAQGEVPGQVAPPPLPAAGQPTAAPTSDPVSRSEADEAWRKFREWSRTQEMPTEEKVGGITISRATPPEGAAASGLTEWNNLLTTLTVGDSATPAERLIATLKNRISQDVLTKLASVSDSERAGVRINEQWRKSAQAIEREVYGEIKSSMLQQLDSLKATQTGGKWSNEDLKLAMANVEEYAKLVSGIAVRAGYPSDTAASIESSVSAAKNRLELAEKMVGKITGQPGMKAIGIDRPSLAESVAPDRLALPSPTRKFSALPPSQRPVTTLTGPDGKGYKFRVEGFQEWGFKPGGVTLITPVEDVPGLINGSTYADLSLQGQGWSGVPEQAKLAAQSQLSNLAIGDVEQAVIRILGTDSLPDSVRVIHDPNVPHPGWYENGKVTVNAAYAGTDEELRQVVLEEGGHGIVAMIEAGQIDDKKLNAALITFIKRLNERKLAAEAAQRPNQSLTQVELAEEAMLQDIINGNPNLAERVWNALKRWLKKVFNIDLRQTDRDFLLQKFLAWYAMGPEARAGRSIPKRMLVASNAVVTPPGAARSARTAHHGTPHKVDKFTTDKIGTGEGAQVYGWGLYFAEEPRVAEDYRNKLGKPEVRDTYGAKTPEGSFIGWADDSDYSAHGVRDSELSQAIVMGRGFAKRIFRMVSDNGTDSIDDAAGIIANTFPFSGLRLSNSVLSAVVAKIKERGSLVKAGNTYTVSLNVEPEQLLDWDKPLSEQPAVVRELQREVTNTIARLSGVEASTIRLDTAKDLYHQLATSISGSRYPTPTENAYKEASMRLAALGIKGIRYLDQGSRGNLNIGELANGKYGVIGANYTLISEHATLEEATAALKAANAKQTYNYVVFDGNDIKITHENGQPVSFNEASTASAQPGSGAMFAAPRVPGTTAREPEQRPIQIRGTRHKITGTTMARPEVVEQGAMRAEQWLQELGFATRRDGSGFVDVWPEDKVSPTYPRVKALLDKVVEVKRDHENYQDFGTQFLDFARRFAVGQQQLLDQQTTPDIAYQNLIATLADQAQHRFTVAGQTLNLVNDKHKDDVLRDATNFKGFIARIIDDGYGGKVAGMNFDRLKGFFREWFTDAELDKATTEAEFVKLIQDQLDRGGIEPGSNVYRKVQGTLQPRKKKKLEKLLKKVPNEEAAQFIIEKYLSIPGNTLPAALNKLSNRQKLLELMKPATEAKVADAVHLALWQAERYAAFDVWAKDNKDDADFERLAQAYTDKTEAGPGSEIIGPDPTVAQIAAGLAKPRYAHWAQVRYDLEYSPVTDERVRKFIQEGFSGTRFPDPTRVPRGEDTRIDLRALAFDRDGELNRVMAAHLDALDAEFESADATQESRLRIIQHIREQLLAQVERIQNEYLTNFFEPKLDAPTTRTPALQKLLASDVTSSQFLNHPKFKALLERTTNQHLKGTDWNALATSTRAQKREWISQTMALVAAEEGFTPAEAIELQPMVYTILAEKLMAEEQRVANRLINSPETTYDKKPAATEEEKVAKVERAKDRLAATLKAGGGNTITIDTIARKQLVTRLLPKMGQMARMAMDWPVAKQEEYAKQFARELAQRMDLDPAVVDKIEQAFNQAFATRFALARRSAQEKAWKAMSPEEKVVVASNKEGGGLWGHLLKFFNSGGLDTNDALLSFTDKKAGWRRPTEAEINQFRKWLKRIEALKSPTERQIADAAGDPVKLEQAARERELALNDGQIHGLINRLEAQLKAWAKPTSIPFAPRWWTDKHIRENTNRAIFEFALSNVLTRITSMPRQLMELATARILGTGTRAYAEALNAYNEKMAKYQADKAAGVEGATEPSTNELWSDLAAGVSDSARSQLEAMKVAKPILTEGWKGRGVAKHLDSLDHGMATADRMVRQIDKLRAEGRHAEAFMLGSANLGFLGFKAFRALDALQGAMAEWQAMHLQARAWMRTQGWSKAQIDQTMERIFAEFGERYAAALAISQQNTEGEDGPASESEVAKGAWNLVVQQAYHSMAMAEMPADEFQRQNYNLKQIEGWNFTPKGPGGALITAPLTALTNAMSKYVPFIPGMFARSMGISANKALTFAGGGFIPAMFEGDPTYEGPVNRAQRQAEAMTGVTFGGIMGALAAMGVVVVRLAWRAAVAAAARRYSTSSWLSPLARTVRGRDCLAGSWVFAASTAAGVCCCVAFGLIVLA